MLMSPAQCSMPVCSSVQGHQGGTGHPPCGSPKPLRAGHTWGAQCEGPEAGKSSMSLEAGAAIHVLCCSPERHRLVRFPWLSRQLI